MSKIEELIIQDKNYGWVIKINNKNSYVYSGHYFTDKLVIADICECESQAQAIIDDYNLQNCHPVKVEVRVIGE